jgi:hypothetical protein
VSWVLGSRQSRIDETVPAARYSDAAHISHASGGGEESQGHIVIFVIFAELFAENNLGTNLNTVTEQRPTTYLKYQKSTSAELAQLKPSWLRQQDPEGRFLRLIE